ncbi:tRNA1(Val) (adenine(37)-N6)-methyltransferase [Lacticaseibacillus thailandensis]|uniref:Methyltransferase n=1 Tax=Lacticaseibacillus thailandensis DSM 22698 = JCM 13996 TaxID=1423810 RepID=A0A0R2C9G2_9LACO|nr:tRNA1(Val) (adenine(37)-N6)-methyltransferase [Lacticaseibacillus thailandensis]KRM88215.1 methyltransferase [Lacticaseibacillus thailandensis DSM 22698 = JCM 13996]
MDLAANERIDELRRDGTKIIQSPGVFAFSLDAVLLADFAVVHPRDQVVDLAAGNGAVGLFVAGRVPGVHVTMVELQAQLASMARRSVSLNGFDDRVQVIQGDLADTWSVVSKDSVDVVTCNPPYFKVQPGSVQNPNTALALARHELTTDFATVVRITAGLLKTGGKAFFVHRPDRLVELLSTLAAADLAPKRIRFVHPKAGKEANMVLIEAIRSGRPDGVRILPPFVVYRADGQYTDEMAAIFDD